LAAFVRFSERLNWKIMENGKRPIHTTMNVYGKAMVPTQRRRSQQNCRQNGPHHTVGHGPRRWPTKPSRPFHYLPPLLAGILDLETTVYHSQQRDQTECLYHSTRESPLNAMLSPKAASLDRTKLLPIRPFLCWDQLAPPRMWRQRKHTPCGRREICAIVRFRSD
jgi:hypothetical protein